MTQETAPSPTFNLTSLLIIVVIDLIIFFAIKYSGYQRDDQETVRLRNQARYADSLRFEQLSKAKNDSIVLELLLKQADTSHTETNISLQKGQEEVERARIINKKIRDEIQDTTLSSSDRINLLRLLLSRSKNDPGSN